MQDTPFSDLAIFILVIAFLFTVLIGFIVVFLFLHKKKQLQNRQEKAALRAQYEQEILQTQIEIQNQTLQRVGEELHDNVGQLLSVVKWQLGVLEEEKIPQISEVSETVGKAIHELRALSKSLDGDVVKDFGLVSSLQHELGRIEYAGKCRTHLHVAGERGQADVQKEMVLFRIAQEVLNNALKHAHAQHLSVSLQYTPNTLLFSIEDDGKGFEMTAVKSRPIEASGAGLRNIQRRAELLGGTCRIGSEIGGGTKVLLEIPL